MDLATNALQAGATDVIVQIKVNPISKFGDEIVVTVEDNGVGHFPQGLPTWHQFGHAPWAVHGPVGRL